MSERALKLVEAKIPFVQARWYTPTTGRTIKLIVLHSAEIPEKGSSAENIARYFATTDRKVSAHYCVDPDSIVQSVQTRDVAYAAPGANHNGVHLELAGYARQTRAEWQDKASHAILENAAALCARVLLPKFEIPALYRGQPADLKAGVPGITTHARVSAAFKRSTHTDPGPGFPITAFLRLVREMTE